jgi:hypothetical protein
MATELKKSRPRSAVRAPGTTLAGFVVHGLHLQDVVADSDRWALPSSERLHECPVVRREVSLGEQIRFAEAALRDLFGPLAAGHPLGSSLMTPPCASALMEGVCGTHGLPRQRKPAFRPKENIEFSTATLLMPVARSIAVDFAVRLAAAQVALETTPILARLAAWTTDDSLFHTVLRALQEDGRTTKPSGRSGRTRELQRHFKAARERSGLAAPRATLATIRSLVDDDAHRTALRFASLVDDIAGVAREALGAERLARLARGTVTLAVHLVEVIKHVYPQPGQGHPRVGSPIATLAGGGARGFASTRLLEVAANAVRSPVLFGEVFPGGLKGIPWADMLRIVHADQRRGRPSARVPRKSLRAAADRVRAALDGVDWELVSSAEDVRVREVEQAELGIVAYLVSPERRGSILDAAEILTAQDPKHPLLAAVKDA